MVRAARGGVLDHPGEQLPAEAAPAPAPAPVAVQAVAAPLAAPAMQTSAPAVMQAGVAPATGDLQSVIRDQLAAMAQVILGVTGAAVVFA